MKRILGTLALALVIAASALASMGSRSVSGADCCVPSCDPACDPSPACCPD
jgi:hypothetical protein